MKTISLNQIFDDARTHNVWQDKPVADELLKQIYRIVGKYSSHSLSRAGEEPDGFGWW